MDNRTELRAICVNKDTTLFMAPDGAVWSSLRVKLNSDSTYRIEHASASSTVNPDGVTFTPHELSLLPNLKMARKILKNMSRTSSVSRARTPFGWIAIAAVVAVCVGGGVGTMVHVSDRSASAKDMAMMMASQGGANDDMGSMGGMVSPNVMSAMTQAHSSVQAETTPHAPVHIFQPVKNNGAFFKPKTPIPLPAPSPAAQTAPAPTVTQTPQVPPSAAPVDDADKAEKISQMKDTLDDLKQIPDVLPGSDYASWKELRQVMPEKKSAKTSTPTAPGQ